MMIIGKILSLNWYSLLSSQKFSQRNAIYFKDRAHFPLGIIMCNELNIAKLVLTLFGFRFSISVISHVHSIEWHVKKLRSSYAAYSRLIVMETCYCYHYYYHRQNLRHFRQWLWWVHLYASHFIEKSFWFWFMASGRTQSYFSYLLLFFFPVQHDELVDVCVRVYTSTSLAMRDEKQGAWASEWWYCHRYHIMPWSRQEHSLNVYVCARVSDWATQMVLHQ